MHAFRRRSAVQPGPGGSPAAAARHGGARGAVRARVRRLRRAHLHAVDHLPRHVPPAGAAGRVPLLDQCRLQRAKDVNNYL